MNVVHTDNFDEDLPVYRRVGRHFALVEPSVGRVRVLDPQLPVVVQDVVEADPVVSAVRVQADGEQVRLVAGLAKPRNLRQRAEDQLKLITS